MEPAETRGCPTDQPLASIAKREEWIYVYGQEEEPTVLDKFSPILHLVQTIRDEAHRFAVSRHRARRSARTLHSRLDELGGVGPRRRKLLVQTFGSPQGVKEASLEDLQKALGPAVGKRVFAQLHEEPHAETASSSASRG